MSKKDDTVFLRHILDASNKIEEYTGNVNEMSFHQNTLIQDGVIRQIEIIGEATGRISKELQDSYPNIPWQDISGMRNKLIHEYFGVNLQAVWLTATNDVPFLKKEVQKILSGLKKNAKNSPQLSQ